MALQRPRRDPRFRAIVRFGLGIALVWAATFTQAAGAEGVMTATIVDPALNMQAYSVRIPAGWRFDGTVLQGPACDEIPYPAYRAYSADGLSEMRTMPRLDWTYNTLQPGRQASGQCLPLARALSAREFLSYFARMIGARYVGDMTVAPRVRARTAAALAQVQAGAARIRGFRATGDVAAIRVLSTNGTFAIEQRLRAWVLCKSAPFLQGSTLSGCFARVDVVRAPKGKLDDLARRVDDLDLNTAPSNPAWSQREAQVLMARGNARLQAQAAHNAAVMQAQRQRFEQSMAIQQHNHEQFLAQMQRSTDSSMRAANTSMNARSTAASDWVDYALDQQTVTGSGGTVKVSSAYGQTWSNGQQWYQTNDPNANPNGVLGGTWKRQTVVHGNGAPR